MFEHQQGIQSYFWYFRDFVFVGPDFEQLLQQESNLSVVFVDIDIYFIFSYG